MENEDKLREIDDLLGAFSAQGEAEERARQEEEFRGKETPFPGGEYDSLDALSRRVSEEIRTRPFGPSLPPPRPQCVVNVGNQKLYLSVISIGGIGKPKKTYKLQARCDLGHQSSNFAERLGVEPKDGTYSYKNTGRDLSLKIEARKAFFYKEKDRAFPQEDVLQYINDIKFLEDILRSF